MTTAPDIDRRSFETHAEVMEFCRSEFKRIWIPDRDLFLLATSKAGLLVPDAKFSIPVVLDRVGRALREGKGLSLLRVGNGEGNAVSMTMPRLEKPTIEEFYTEFRSQNYWPIELTEAVSFSHRVKSALLDADIIGFRSFLGGEETMISKYIDLGDAYAALGIAYARDFLRECLNAGVLANKVVTSTWIHLDFVKYIDDLLALGDRIIVVTGRDELRSPFARRLGSRLMKFIPVPVQGHISESLATSHYYQAFPKIVEELSANLKGCLVLVGAGLFGKVYCATAKRSGAVAIDLGSAFDVFSGLTTRPAFARYKFEGAAWV